MSYDIADEVQSLTVMNGQTQVSSQKYSYDLNGNRTRAIDQTNTNVTYSYDEANRLVNFNGAYTYGYDGNGLRMSKTNVGTVEAFVWDTSGSLPLVVEDGINSFVNGPDGLPLEQITGAGVVHTYYHDQLGSIRALADNTGTVEDTYSFDAYGNLSSSSGSVANPFRFAGQCLDAESSMYYLRAREYDPTAVQFVTRDRIARATRRPYVYAADSPLSNVDPAGLKCAGIGYGAEGFLGDGAAGVGLIASFDVSVCSNGDISLLSSGGAFAGGNDSNARPIGWSVIDAGGPHTAVGGFVGCGGHAFYSPDADSTKRLRGPFQTVDGAVGIGPAVSVGASSGTASVVQVGPPLEGGGGIGFGALEMDTSTSSWATYNVFSKEWRGFANLEVALRETAEGAMCESRVNLEPRYLATWTILTIVVLALGALARIGPFTVFLLVVWIATSIAYLGLWMRDVAWLRRELLIVCTQKVSQTS